jgi:outer membrane protein assembly factor BamE (lipoprotein component of BamABCDE complex)
MRAAFCKPDTREWQARQAVRMNMPLSRGLRGVAVLALVVLAACAQSFRNHGYAPTDAELAAIGIGAPRATVEEALGQPSSSGVLSEGAWYYVSSRMRHYAWRAPEEVDRQVVAISFDKSGRVENIERFGLEDGRVVALSRRVTETNIKGISLIQQILRNFGRFDIGEALSRDR